MGLLAGFSGLYALYCLAKWWQEEEEEEDRRSEHCQSKKQNLLRRAIGLRVDSQETADSQQGKYSWVICSVEGEKGPLTAAITTLPGDNGSLSYPSVVLVKPHHGLDQQHLQVILGLLKRTSDTSIREHALVTIGNSAAFTVNQDLIRSLGGLSVIANCLLDEVTSVKVKAMNALTNLSLNVANQEELKVWIPQVLKIQETATLNSELQIAGLRMLTNISVVNSHHHMMTNSIPHFLKLLVDGTENVKIQALKSW
ncbi:armadillo repeat-containing protein 10 [Pristis pectinata]|uniref:armadillo repeat-containing protein 10 n=1 Tax=Pristis pectinata TaxID=685728 RepID=UPI00223E652E|nr:armadillo repeat-containing protein 10 [Pristis pectinata]